MPTHTRKARAKNRSLMKKAISFRVADVKPPPFKKTLIGKSLVSKIPSIIKKAGKATRSRKKR